MLALSLVILTFTPVTARNATEELWQYSGSFCLLTTPEGASLPEGRVLADFPILIRLNSDFFDFTQARPHGEDVRFTQLDGRPLAYQIESWDPVQKIAAIWVRIPEITGNARQQIQMKWGNPAAVSDSDGPAVFSETNGYRSVWHMEPIVQDSAGLVTTEDRGTEPALGMIGRSRRFAVGTGLLGGEQVAGYPSGVAPSTTEAWLRPSRPNSTIIGWGNEEAQGKVVMQYRSPPHLQMDCYFSGANVQDDAVVPLNEWTHVMHTYQNGEAKLYVNGVLDEVNRDSGSPLRIKTPCRLWIGGWYNNFDFVSELDEVRVSSVVRSEDWIKLQYENQKPAQTLVGPLVRPGNQLSVTPEMASVSEGQSLTLKAEAGVAQKLYWILKRGASETIVASDQLQWTFQAGRIPSSPSTGSEPADSTVTVALRAIYPYEVRTKEVSIQVTESIPNPEFTLKAPADWDGRQTIEVTPDVSNTESLQSAGVNNLQTEWKIDGVAVICRKETGRLILTRSQGHGPMTITATISISERPTTRLMSIPSTVDCCGESEKRN